MEAIQPLASVVYGRFDERLSERTGEVGLDVSSLLNLRLQEIKIVDSLRLKKAGRDSGFFVL